MPRDPDLPEPEFPDDVEDATEEIPEEEPVEEIPPAPQRMPEFYAYFKVIIESKEVPEHVRESQWPAYTRDIKLGKLNTTDEFEIRISHSMYETAKMLLDRMRHGRISMEEFVDMLGTRTVLPAVISRGRGGFERTMQNAQISATISAGKQDVRESGVISQLFSNVKKAFGGGGE